MNPGRAAEEKPGSSGDGLERWLQRMVLYADRVDALNGGARTQRYANGSSAEALWREVQYEGSWFGIAMKKQRARLKRTLWMMRICGKGG